ncbi:hypothetical protein OF83DRAFT_1072017 [Amylostereum chailletii]|nr:hypothetical protein OF83DRAFT_1072017 [Amylostereum chailletii]
MQSSIPETPTTGTAMTPKAKLEHDEFFYFHGVVFQAENKLFKVPRYGLPAEDGVFAAMFALPTAGDREAEGSSDENPIVLPAEVSAHDFRSLLKASYPPCRAAPNTKGMDVEEWMSVLKLANMWCLDELRLKAIDASEWLIASKTAQEKILLGKRYHVARWLIDGYVALGQRKEMISDGEREELGIETYVGLVTLRERSWEWAGDRYGAAGQMREGYDFRGQVIQIFGKELEQVREFSYPPSPEPAI